MCGIVAFLGAQPDALAFLTEAIKRVKNRGYDSAGICSIGDDNNFQITKYAQCNGTKTDAIEKVSEIVLTTHKPAKVGIGHTRWATCGTIVDRNAHPHTDYKERIALVHNGTLSNVEELRAELVNKKGIVLKSETDSELIAHCIGLYLDEGLSLLEATKNALQNKIRGTWGIVVIKRDEPDKIVVSRCGSPIVMAMTSDSVLVGSESIVFQNYTNRFMRLDDNEILEINVNNIDQFQMNNVRRVQPLLQVSAEHKPAAPFTSFFEQEIQEQIQSAQKVMNDGGRLAGERGSTKLGGLEMFAEQISGVENLLMVGCGTSYHAALAASKIFKRLRCASTISVVEASEFTDDDLPLQKGGGIFISQSGETFDVKRALESAKKAGMFTMGCVNVPASVIASQVHCGVYLNCGREVSVAATKSFTSQVIALLLVAVWMSHKKNKDLYLDDRAKLIEEFQKLPMVIGRTLAQIDSQCRKVASAIKNEESLYILGKGACVAIAKEAALKIKEVTYIHADGYPAGELKHGSIALIDSENPLSTKICLIILDDEHFHDMALALSEVKSRKAYTVVISNCPEKLPRKYIDELIEIPPLGELSFLLAILPFHKLTLYIAQNLGRNIDQPRNLAKTVTVG